MTSTPTKRVSLSLDEPVAAALKAAAALRGLRPTSLAASFVIAALGGETPPMTSAAPAAPSSDPEPPPAGATWLQLDRGRAWRRAAWDAVDELRRDYPDLADLIKPGWTGDRFTRDGVISLAVWRMQLDRGAHADPRTEHQWLAALRDFKQMLTGRAGRVGAPVRPLDPPDSWT